VVSTQWNLCTRLFTVCMFVITFSGSEWNCQSVISSNPRDETRPPSKRNGLWQKGGKRSRRFQGARFINIRKLPWIDPYPSTELNSPHSSNHRNPLSKLCYAHNKQRSAHDCFTQ